MVADGAVHEGGIADAAVVGFDIRQERNLGPGRLLDVIKPEESVFRRLAVREIMPFIRPGVSFAPETEHVRIHELHERTAVVLVGQQLLHLFEIADQILVVPRLEMLVLEAGLGRIPFPFSLETVQRDFLQDKVRQRIFQCVGVGQHHPETDTLAILGGLVEGNLPIVVKIEFSGLLLDMTPVRADIDLRSQRETEQFVDGCLQRFSGYMRGSVIP